MITLIKMRGYKDIISNYTYLAIHVTKRLSQTNYIYPKDTYCKEVISNQQYLSS